MQLKKKENAKKLKEFLAVQNNILDGKITSTVPNKSFTMAMTITTKAEKFCKADILSHIE